MSLQPEDDQPDEILAELAAETVDRRVRLIATVVGVFVFALIALFAVGRTAARESEPSSLLGRRVPPLAGPLVPTGAEYPANAFDVDDHRGQWVLVNFFATWCAGCIVEHPELVALEGSQNFQLVSVVFDDDHGRVESFFAEQGGEWPVISDASVAVNFQIAQIPESFLVAPSGVVVEHFIGGITAQSVIDTVCEVESC